MKTKLVLFAANGRNIQDMNF